MLRHIVITCCLLSTLCLCGCEAQQQPETAKKELLIYCGTAMAAAVREVSDIFETQENCTVKIIKEGSGVLLHSIQINQTGDLYLPGCESYLNQASAEGLIIEDVIIGYQHPTIMVAKNNPLNIDTNLTNFFNTTFRTAIGDPESGSIGRQTRILLQKSGIYHKVIEHAQLILPDSRALYDAIVANKVDLTINWLSEGQHQHSLFVDTFSLPDNNVHRVTLKMALLRYSQHIDLAKRYLSLSCSPTAEVIFTRYGFGKTSHE